MSFDGLFTKFMTEEVKEHIVSGRISRVYQPFTTELLLTVRANRKNYQLLLSAHPSFARMHFTEEKYDNPPTPPMFCMLLRKHVEGGIIEKIEQIEMERIIKFTIKGKDELGDIRYKHLYIELMGRHSNIILVDAETNKIIDSIKHISRAQSSVRTVLPGQRYTLPPAQQKLNPLMTDEETLLAKLDFNQGKMDQQLVHTFSGLSPLIASEIIFRAKLVNQKTIVAAFFSVIDLYKKKQIEPQMIVTDKKEYFSIIPLTHLQGEVKTFTSLSELLDRYYFGKAERDRVKQQAYDMERFLRNEKSKNEKKIIKLQETLTDADKAEKYQKYGELLTANLHLVKRGDASIEVVDYYDENQGTIIIQLDPQKSPAENAQHYFRKYTKAKNSVEVVLEQIAKAEEEIVYLEQLISQMENASPRDIEEIREELIEEGYLKKRGRDLKHKKKDTKPQIEKYISSTGIEIFVGKNNKQNEYLTNRFARQDEIWLHTKDIPGSHVLIRSVDPDEQTLQEAAILAAYFSKAKHSSNVPVDYTKIRYVKKPNGAKPGFVIYENQTTIYVTPDEDLVRKLRVQ